MPTWLHLDLGQIITTILLALILGGVRAVYNLVHRFVSKVNDNEDTLKSTSEMVDTHSFFLLKAKIMSPPVKRVHMGRRATDPIFVDDEIHLPPT